MTAILPSVRRLPSLPFFFAAWLLGVAAMLSSMKGVEFLVLNIPAGFLLLVVALKVQDPNDIYNRLLEGRSSNVGHGRGARVYQGLIFAGLGVGLIIYGVLGPFGTFGSPWD